METRTILVVILVFLAGMVSGAGLSSYVHHEEQKKHTDALKINTEAVAAIAAKRAKLEEEKEKH